MTDKAPSPVRDPEPESPPADALPPAWAEMNAYERAAWVIGWKAAALRRDKVEDPDGTRDAALGRALDRVKSYGRGG